MSGGALVDSQCGVLGVIQSRGVFGEGGVFVRRCPIVVQRIMHHGCTGEALVRRRPLPASYISSFLLFGLKCYIVFGVRELLCVLCVCVAGKSGWEGGGERLLKGGGGGEGAASDRDKAPYHDSYLAR